MNNEELESVIDNMFQTIRRFCYEHGKHPEAIFISKPLWNILGCCPGRYIDVKRDHGILIFAGIPAHTYACDRFEYYLFECRNDIRISDGSCESMTISGGDPAFIKETIYKQT